jgi:hypothetical protein
MPIACCITKAKNTHSDYVILKYLQYNSSCTNTPQCYVLCTLPVLFTTTLSMTQFLSHTFTIANRLYPYSMQSGIKYSFQYLDRATLVPRALKANWNDGQSSTVQQNRLNQCELPTSTNFKASVLPRVPSNYCHYTTYTSHHDQLRVHFPDCCLLTWSQTPGPQLCYRVPANTEQTTSQPPLFRTFQQ